LRGEGYVVKSAVKSSILDKIGNKGIFDDADLYHIAFSFPGGSKWMKTGRLFRMNSDHSACESSFILFVEYYV
jgi:hypothetical protein